MQLRTFEMLVQNWEHYFQNYKKSEIEKKKQKYQQNLKKQALEVGIVVLGFYTVKT